MAAAKKGFYSPLDKAILKEEGAFAENRARTLEYLRLLSADTMLYSFRATFGVDTKGAEPPHGWDEPTGLLRGHSLGHFLSALALAYSSTQDEFYKEKLAYIAEELSSLQDMSKGKPSEFKTECDPDNCRQYMWSRDPSTWGEGFISAYSPDQFALLEQFTPYARIWAPYYTLHKILAGLIECCQRAGNDTALKVAKGIGDWVYDRLSALTPEHRNKMWKMYIAGEYGGMNESLARLYAITGEEKYLAAAKMFDNENIFPGLANGEDTVQQLHANQHIPQIVGAALEYPVTADEYYHDIAKHAFEIITGHHMYSIGGVGRGEAFREPDLLAKNIEHDRNCETCAAYNMLKLARELYAYEPDNASYMHYYERTLINHILSSQNPRSTPYMHNGVTYMLPIGPGARKDYSDDLYSFTCCHGTGMENHVKYQDAAYFITMEGRSIPRVYINLYIASKLSLPEYGIEITLDSQFPHPEKTVILGGEGEYEVYFRVPEYGNNRFCDDSDAVIETENNDYVGFCHKTGATVTVKIDSGETGYLPRIETTPDKLGEDTLGSLLYGPFVMVAKDPRREFLTLKVPKDREKFEKAFTLSYNDEAGAYCLVGCGHIFVPMYKAHGFAYHTYFKIVEE